MERKSFLVSVNRPNTFLGKYFPSSGTVNPTLKYTKGLTPWVNVWERTFKGITKVKSGHKDGALIHWD